MADRDLLGLLAIGGVASLCCVGISAIAGAAVTSGAVAGGLGASAVQVLVTVVTVGIVGLAWGWRRSGRSDECGLDR